MGEHKEFTDDDICPVDLHVKTRLVNDVIRLCKKSRESVQELSEYGSLTKIHPEGIENAEDAVEIYPLIRNIRDIFYNITPIKNKKVVTS